MQVAGDTPLLQSNRDLTVFLIAHSIIIILQLPRWFKDVIAPSFPMEIKFLLLIYSLRIQEQGDVLNCQLVIYSIINGDTRIHNVSLNVAKLCTFISSGVGEEELTCLLCLLAPSLALSYFIRIEPCCGLSSSSFLFFVLLEAVEGEEHWWG